MPSTTITTTTTTTATATATTTRTATTTTAAAAIIRTKITNLQTLTIKKTFFYLSLALQNKKKQICLKFLSLD
jgi:hypothetical protein